MATKRQHDGRWVLDTAKTVAEKLRKEKGGTRLRILSPTSSWFADDTKGWCVQIGSLGKDEPKLQIWYDRVSGGDKRKLYAGFYAPEKRVMTKLVSQVPSEIIPVRKITDDDTIGDDQFSFAEKISADEYGMAFLETYDSGDSYFGIYDPTRPTKERINLHFCNRARDFLISAVRSVSSADHDDPHWEDYGKIENRKIVASHIRRERNRTLVSNRKNQDGFRCYVCGLVFEDMYGSLGADFAEVHHKVPLAKQKERVVTRLDDLVTVCANCHRMLHRMEGKEGDVAKLRKLVRRKKRS